jgi:alkanesulfonate monooxygenase SsuD/methylene tetrahydromethanopterin reductase-like flavin-dependent oxidoreductase (luciferase family)
VRRACENTGRDPDELVYSVAATVCVGTDEAELAGRAAAIGRDPAELRERAFGGTPAELVERLKMLSKLGVSRVYLQVLDLADVDHLELIAAGVAPNI